MPEEEELNFTEANKVRDEKYAQKISIEQGISIQHARLLVSAQNRGRSAQQRRTQGGKRRSMKKKKTQRRNKKRHSQTQMRKRKSMSFW